MFSKRYLLLFFLMIIFSCQLFAQLGIKAGVNMATEIRSLKQEDIEAGFSPENLNGFHIGLVYQSTFAETRWSTEIGALLSQKGSFFSYKEIDIMTAYNELNYAEVPINIRYTLSLGALGIYGSAGVYAGYLFEGKTVNETKEEILYMKFSELVDKLDYGYSLGAGVELLDKIQLGVTWTRGIKTNPINIQAPNAMPNSKNNTFSIGLVYLF